MNRPQRPTTESMDQWIWMSKWVSKILEFHSILSNLFLVFFSFLVSPFVSMKNEQMSMWRILIWVQWFWKFGKCHWLSGVKQSTIFNYRQIVMNAYQMPSIQTSNFSIFYVHSMTFFKRELEHWTCLIFLGQHFKMIQQLIISKACWRFTFFDNQLKFKSFD